MHIIDPREAANTDVGLQVWVTVTPLSLSISDSVTRVRVRVSAKNPGRDTLAIDNGGLPCVLTDDPIDSKGLLHSMRIADDDSEFDAGPRGDVCGTSLLIFPPRRTRQRDFYITTRSWTDSGYPLVARDYRVRSYFAGYEGYSAVLRMVP